MRKFRYVFALAIVAMLAFAVGCTSEEDFTKNTYKSLKSAEIAYDTGMKVAAEAHKGGIINDEEKIQVIEAARIFHSSFMVASAALEVAVETKDDSQTARDRVLSAMTTMWRNYDRYKALVESLVENFKMPEVVK